MSNVIIDDTYLGDIADAIRGKNGSLDTYTPADMAAAIAAIETGGGEVDLTEFYPYGTTPSGYSTSMGELYVHSSSSSVSTTSYITGVSKSSSSGSDFKSHLKLRGIAIITGTYYSPNYTNTGFLWTADKYLYSLKKGLTYWTPTYILAYNNSGITSSGIADPFRDNLETQALAIKIAEIDNISNGASSPSRTGTPQLKLYHINPSNQTVLASRKFLLRSTSTAQAYLY